MSRLTTGKEKQDFELFMKELKGKGFEVEIVPAYKEAIRQKCGNGFYRTVKEALFQFKYRYYILTFQEGKPAAWSSIINLGWVVINMATSFRLTELISGAIKDARAKDGALIN